VSSDTSDRRPLTADEEKARKRKRKGSPVIETAWKNIEEFQLTCARDLANLTRLDLEHPDAKERYKSELAIDALKALVHACDGARSAFYAIEEGASE
jgi:hypothetical protein